MWDLICWMVFSLAIGVIIGAGIGHYQGYIKGYRDGRKFQMNLTYARYGLDKSNNDHYNKG